MTPAKSECVWAHVYEGGQLALSSECDIVWAAQDTVAEENVLALIHIVQWSVYLVRTSNGQIGRKLDEKIAIV